MARQSSKEKYKTRPDGRKMTTIRTGRYHDNGKPEVIIVYGKTDQEVDEKKAAIKYELGKGLIVAPSRMTVEEYSTRWLTLFKSKRRGNTRAMYENIVYKHIVPEIGAEQLRTLSRMHCQRLINSRWEKPNTCSKIALTMKQIEASALADKIISNKFWIGIEMPPTNKKKKKRALTDEEKKAFESAELPEMERCYVSLLFGCGMRREEALGLCKKCINEQGRIVKIERVLTFDKNNGIIEETGKTKDSIREIPIPISVWEDIKAYISQLKDNDYLFTTKAGKVMTHSAYTKMWKRILDAVNLLLDEPTEVTAHYFRHNYATMLYYSGISELKAVELMGHADGKMIHEVYAHLDESKENTAARLDEVVRY